MKRYFRVANHTFSLSYNRSIADEILAQYRPFEIDEQGDDTLFDIEIVDSLAIESCENGEIVVEGRCYRPKLVDTDLSRDDMIRVDVYQGDESSTLYQLFMPQSPSADSYLAIDRKARSAKVYISRFVPEILHNTLIVTYFTFAVAHQTILLHASAVLLDGKAQIFLGRSGTGKSTQSDQWLKLFPKAELLNDDHPVVRVEEDGEIRLYGSPWSGKRPIYRNISAPLKAIVRIKRAKANRAVPLSPLKAYASLLTTTSSMQWDKEMLELKIQTIERVTAGVANFELEALPNVDAARVCHKAIYTDE